MDVIESFIAQQSDQKKEKSVSVRNIDRDKQFVGFNTIVHTE
jgi:hypothetical protein